MKTRLIFAVLIILALLVFMTGCGKKSKNTLQIDEDGIVTFSALTSYVIGNTAWGDDPVSREITERTKVRLDLEYAIGDFNEKLAAILAAGDYPDMILSVDNYQLADLIDAEAVVPLTEYLEEGGENIKEAFGEKIGAMKHRDGEYYGFNKDYGRIPPHADWYVQIQYTVLEEFGFPKINTLDELGDLIEQYMEKYQEYNGNPLVGILSPADQDSLRHGINNAALRTAGFQDDGEFYIDPETLEATYGMVTPEAKAYIKWLNDMYHRGLFSIDSFTFSHNDIEQEVIKGNVLCVTSPEWALGGAEATIKTVNGTPERAYAKIPIYVSKEAAANSQVSNYDSLGTWKSVITKNCPDPKLAFEFFDAMWAEENQALVWWGIEGEHYDVIDGKRVLKDGIAYDQRNDPDFRLRTGISLYNYWAKGEMAKDSTGQFINPFMTPETIRESYTDYDRKVLAAYDENANVWKDLWPEPKESKWGFAWKLTPPRGDGAKAYTKIREEINGKFILKMVKAESDEEFNKLWDDYVAECYDVGIGIREDEITAALKKRMEEWYGE